MQARIEELEQRVTLLEQGQAASASTALAIPSPDGPAPAAAPADGRPAAAGVRCRYEEQYKDYGCQATITYMAI